ncbi:MAG: hypothetical protein KatS3mg078_1322 [Deltaproteobacteria bacterium]|nr:MAG: hypothetical protein KatS3mg078_1322 [Deltaproteobacteria bacterium]
MRKNHRLLICPVCGNSGVHMLSSHFDWYSDGSGADFTLRFLCESGHVFCRIYEARRGHVAEVEYVDPHHLDSGIFNALWANRVDYKGQ